MLMVNRATWKAARILERREGGGLRLCVEAIFQLKATHINASCVIRRFVLCKYRIISTKDFDDWSISLQDRDRRQIAKRLELIRDEGHFGDHHSVTNDDSVWELRWENGRRIYYAYLFKQRVLLLLGGNKNGQTKDIKRAQTILSKNVRA